MLFRRMLFHLNFQDAKALTELVAHVSLHKLLQLMQCDVGSGL